MFQMNFDLSFDVGFINNQQLTTDFHKPITNIKFNAMSQGRIIRPEAEKSRLILPRVGLLKVGYKNEKNLPQSVDYFIPSGKYAALFTKAYGERPQTIQIVFPDDDPAKVCNERYEYRDDEGRLIASGDGQNFQVWDGKGYMNLDTTKFPRLMEQVGIRHPNKAVAKGGDGWQIVLTLNFIIPLVRGVAGVWQFTTKGTASTIPQIRTVFDGMLEKRGFCKGIVFDLSVQFATSQKPGDKSRYPVVSLVANESEANILKMQNAFKPLKGLGEG